MIKRIILIGALGAIIASCSNHPKGWELSGEVNGPDEYTLSLEGFNNGLWYVVDSLKTHDGEFRYASEAPAPYPEIMRLGLGQDYIYFPVDSIDRINVYAQAEGFSTDYKLDGTAQARTIKSLDSLINVSVAERGAELTLSDAELKRDLFERAFSNQSVMPLYYLINKSIGKKPLYDVSAGIDQRYLGAVAQRFVTERPDDPRGKLLAEAYKRLRANQSGEVRQLEVPEASLIDIVRADSRGVQHSLAEMADKGNVVILSFTAYTIEGSPAYNVVLNNIYEKYHSKGLDIYQIAFDGDESAWKSAARNLPWTAVWNSTTDGDLVLANYNVGALPTTFIIDRTGTIAQRIENPADLESAVAKYIN